MSKGIELNVIIYKIRSHPQDFRVARMYLMIQHVAEVFEIKPRDWLTSFAHASVRPITAERECNVLCALGAMALSPTISIVLSVFIIKSVNSLYQTISK